MLYQKVLIAFAFLTIAAKVNAAPIAPAVGKDDKTNGYIPEDQRDEHTTGYIPEDQRDEHATGFIPKDQRSSGLTSSGPSPDFLQPIMGAIQPIMEKVNPEQLQQQFGGAGKGDGNMLQSFDPQSLTSSLTSGTKNSESSSPKKPSDTNEEENTNIRRQEDEKANQNSFVPNPEALMGEFNKFVESVSHSGSGLNKATTKSEDPEESELSDN